jgi:hypothetical protein
MVDLSEGARQAAHSLFPAACISLRAFLGCGQNAGKEIHRFAEILR